jgi:hypothetical protein
MLSLITGNHGSGIAWSAGPNTAGVSLPLHLMMKSDPSSKHCDFLRHLKNSQQMMDKAQNKEISKRQNASPNPNLYKIWCCFSGIHYSDIF